MRKSRFQGRDVSIYLLIFILAFLLAEEAAYPAKPRFKAEHNSQKKQADIQLKIALPEYSLVEEGEWMVLGCNDRDAFEFTKTGEPALVSLTYLISIPEDAKVKKIKIRPYATKIRLDEHIMPVPEPVIIGEEPIPPVPDEKIYGSARPYPKEDFDYSIAKKGTTTMLVLTVYPFKYIGKSKTLIVNRYSEAEITLSSENWDPDPGPRNAVDKNLKKRLVNPDSAFFSRGGAK